MVPFFHPDAFAFQLIRIYKPLFAMTTAELASTAGEGHTACYALA